MPHEGPREISEWGGVGLGRIHFGWPSERGEHLTHKRQGCGNLSSRSCLAEQAKKWRRSLQGCGTYAPPVTQAADHGGSRHTR